MTGKGKSDHRGANIQSANQGQLGSTMWRGKLERG